MSVRRICLMLAGLLIVFGLSGADRTATGIGPRPVLWYRPTWLPDHLVERDRSAEFDDGAVSRTWLPPGAPDDSRSPQVRLTLSHGTSPDTGNDVLDTAPVDIGGVPGVLVTVRQSASPASGAGPARVQWHPTSGELLTVSVSGLPDTAATAVRVARSVRPDGDTAIACPVSAASLPDGVAVLSVTIRGNTPADWSCGIQTSDMSGQPYPPELEITTARIRPEPGDTPVIVHGRTGYVHAAGTVKIVPVTMVQLDRYGVLVRGSDPEPVVLQILNQLRPTPSDLSWLGRP